MRAGGARATCAPLVFFVAACAGGDVATNPFPDGLDTLVMQPVEVVMTASPTIDGTNAQVVAIDVSRAGTAAIADHTGRVFVRSASNTWSFQLMGAGAEGPVINGLALLPDGRVAVRESTEGRISIRGSDGSEVTSWATTPGRPPHGRDALLAADDGTLFMGIRPELGPDAQPVAFPRPAYVRTSDSGQVLDTLWVDGNVQTDCPTLSEGHFRAGWYEDIRMRYVPKPTWGVGTDGTFAYGCPARYEFTVQRPHDGPIAMSRAWRPHAVSAEERNDFVELWTVQMNNSGIYESWTWRTLSLPEMRPAYRRILPADDGRLWVLPARHSTPEPSPPEWPLVGLPSRIWTEATGGVFDVFGSNGRLLGHVRLPENVPYSGYPNTADPVIRGDTVWAVTVSPEGAQTLSRFLVSGLD